MSDTDGKRNRNASSFADVVEAIQDLTSVTVLVHGGFATKAEAIRKLSELNIPSGRIARILAMQTGDVASTLAKMKKKEGKAAPGNSSKGEASSGEA
ncbi:MAG TPA: hypothetical protein VGM77_12255 [Gemmatimonadales bacterium]|jgi:VIT1/CCC1 family predicted Fe2+/Mn2+ transporter